MAGIKPKDIVHVYATDTEAALEKKNVDAAAVPANYGFAFRAKGYPLLELASKVRPGYLGPFGHDIVAATVLPGQLPDTPFTDAGLALLKGTKDFLVAQKLAAKDFSVDDWIAPEART